MEAWWNVLPPRSEIPALYYTWHPETNNKMMVIRALVSSGGERGFSIRSSRRCRHRRSAKGVWFPGECGGRWGGRRGSQFRRWYRVGWETVTESSLTTQWHFWLWSHTQAVILGACVGILMCVCASPVYILVYRLALPAQSHTDHKTASPFFRVFCACQLWSLSTVWPTLKTKKYVNGAHVGHFNFVGPNFCNYVSVKFITRDGN